MMIHWNSLSVADDAMKLRMRSELVILLCIRFLCHEIYPVRGIKIELTKWWENEKNQKQEALWIREKFLIFGRFLNVGFHILRGGVYLASLSSKM